MDYDYVELVEMTVVGQKVSTTYANNKFSEDISSLWETFFKDGIYQSISNKIDQNPIGLYFMQGVEGEFSFDFATVCKVRKDDNHNLETITVPASTYAKFSFGFPTPENVNKAWEAIANLDLNKDSGFDFEEYNLNPEDESKSTFDCYVSIK